GPLRTLPVGRALAAPAARPRPPPGPRGRAHRARGRAQRAAPRPERPRPPERPHGAAPPADPGGAAAPPGRRPARAALPAAPAPGAAPAAPPPHRAPGRLRALQRRARRLAPARSLYRPPRASRPPRGRAPDPHRDGRSRVVADPLVGAGAPAPGVRHAAALPVPDERADDGGRGVRHAGPRAALSVLRRVAPRLPAPPPRGPAARRRDHVGAGRDRAACRLHGGLL